MKRVMIAGLVAGVLAVPAWADSTTNAAGSDDATTEIAMPSGDAAKGEKVFKKCKACHAVGEGAKNKVGPMLNGIYGAPAGSNEDFKYSKALMAKAEEGLVWDEENLSAFLAKPKKFLPKTKMSFAGLRKDDQIANVIAYMASFK